MYALAEAKNSLEKTIGLPCTEKGHGDLSVACFSEPNPTESAKKLSQKPLPPFFGEAKAIGPYVNYFFSDLFYARVINEASVPTYGRLSAKKSKPFVLEYSQPNPGKPMHLGHIRSTIVGDVCSRLLSFVGKPVVRLNYLNDRGAHIAELITALEEFRDLPKVNNERDLLAYYVKIKKEIDTNTALKEKTRVVLEHLNEHQKQLEKIRQMSWKAFERNYALLDVYFDEIPLETALEKEAHARVNECLEKGLAFKDKDGAIIANLEPFGLSNTVLLRSNGTPLYFTSDLALADWKWKKYAFSESYIFTAAEQNLHFRQLQLLLRKLERPYASHYHHRGFGLIRLAEGKMSTRDGRVVLLEDVLSEVTQEAKKQVLEKAQAQDVEKTSQAIGVGALKFGVLRISLSKEIKFDPLREVEFEGDTSAYVQYAHVRCCGILDKAASFPKTLPSLVLNDSEKQLLKAVALFPEVLSQAAEKLEPHRICEYALDLAHAFTRFYDNTPVLTASNESLRHQRLLLVAVSKNVLALTLELLGIKALKAM